MDSRAASLISKIRLYDNGDSGYKPLAMFMSLILTVAISAADPGIVFAEGYVPTQVSSDPLGSQTVPYVDPWNAAQPGHGPPMPPTIIPGQMIYEEPQLYVCDSRMCCMWHDPRFQSLLTELNPFAPFEFPVLENYFDPYGWQMLTGSYGPQPYRLGWSNFNELSFLPSSPAFGTTGSMQMTEWNSNAKYSKVVAPGVLFDATLWFSAHWWEGPGGVSLPPHVDQLSSDLLLGFFDDGPWSAQIAFHPQIVQTYGATLDSNAYNFDGRAIVTYTSCPHWKVVLGVAVWDRVNTLIVPHAGVIWTPDGRWEVRALFPTSKISYFLGNWRNADFWIYGQYEYTAEAWQTVLSNPTVSERAQFVDQRLTAGIRWDKGRYNFYAEAGYVFDRQTKFSGSSPNFNLGDSAIISFGFRY